jgi:hypothetical protein
MHPSRYSPLLRRAFLRLKSLIGFAIVVVTVFHTLGVIEEIVKRARARR